MSDSSGIGSGSSSGSGLDSGSDSGSEGRDFKISAKLLFYQAKAPLSRKHLQARFMAIQKKGNWKQLKQDIITYNEKREQCIEEQENQKNPIFQKYLKRYKAALGPRQFDCNRLMVYAVCNRKAMLDCALVHELLVGGPIPYEAASDSSLSSTDED